MEARAHITHLRIAPRKVKIVLDLIRGKNANDAMAILKYTPKAAAQPVYQLIKSAMANAEHNSHMDTEGLYVSEVYVTPGPTAKRIQPRAHGRAYRILKRSSHVTLVLKEKETAAKEV